MVAASSSVKSAPEPAVAIPAPATDTTASDATRCPILLTSDVFFLMHPLKPNSDAIAIGFGTQMKYRGT